MCCCGYGPDILVATNIGTHDHRAVCWQLTATIIEQSHVSHALRLGFTCHLSSSTGVGVTKKIGPYEYQFHAQEGKAILKDASEMNFTFSIGEFPYLPDDEVGINLSIYQELDYEFFNFLMLQENGKTFPLQTPVVTCRGSLRRRTAKLFNLLSFIANPILRKRPMLPQYCKPECRNYSHFIETEYQQYKQSNQQRSEDGFIQIVQAKCHQVFRFDQGGDTTETFLKAVREHYQAADLKDRAALILEQHDRWPSILNDTLTYELSRGLFANDISFDSKPPKGTQELDQFYKDLVQDYRQYKNHHQLQSSVSSVITWFASLKDHLTLKPPPFVAHRFSDFHTIARRYFIQLAVIEEYMKENAEKNGVLAQRVAKETIFREPGVMLIQGNEGVHAEMRLFSHHLLAGRPHTSYYGIAKLCCALCHYTFRQFRVAGLHPPETRGTHATLFKWPLPEAFYHTTYMKLFLGNALFEKYVALNQCRRLESTKKGRPYHLQDVTRTIISGLDGVNSDKNLARLEIDPRFQIQGSADHYADNQIPPRLPSVHQNTAVEEELEVLEKTHYPRKHLSFFKPLEVLGRTWRAKKNHSHAYYYLTRAVQIFDQFPAQIEPLQAAQVLNTLGNVCRSLKLYDEASNYLQRALALKQKCLAPPDQISITLNSLGCLHFDRENLYDAHSFFTEALKLAPKEALASLIKRNLAQLDKLYV